jgi:Arc/MetJ-type ribon-helix-helix transcriptional regulator
MTLDLSPEAMALIRRLIETRGYRDPHAVVEEALRLLAVEPSIEDDEAELRALIAEAEASGEPVAVDPENLKDHILNGAPLRPLR